MKTIMITLTVWLAATICVAAQNMIGYTKQETKEVMKSLHQDEWEFKQEQTLASGVETVQYRKKSNPLMLAAYYFYDGVCNHYVHLLPRELLITTIESMNKYYYHQGDGVWVSKDLKLKMTLEMEGELHIAIITRRI